MDILTDTIRWFISAPFILLGWLIIGVLAGEFARRIMGAEDRGCLSDWILGVLGAIVGGFLAGAFSVGTPDGGLSALIINLIVATVGAAILIAIRRAIAGGAPVRD